MEAKPQFWRKWAISRDPDEHYRQLFAHSALALNARPTSTCAGCREKHTRGLVETRP